jgi:hypothetical protein
LTAHWFGAPDNLPALQRTADRLGGGTPIVHKVGLSIRHFIPPTNPTDALVGFDILGKPLSGAEWDIAAPEVIIREAGGMMSDLTGRPHRYNKPNPKIDGGILAAVDPLTHRRILEALQPEFDLSSR